MYATPPDLLTDAGASSTLSQVRRARSGRKVVATMAPPCHTMSRVRDRNISTRVRSREHLLGLEGNKLAYTAAHLATTLAEEGASVAI